MKYKTEEKKKEGRRLSLVKYNCSKKKKECNKRYREKHKEKCYKWSKEWAIKNRERIRFLQNERNKIPEVKERRKEVARKYYAANRIKRLAKDSINNALRARKIFKKPCAICGETKVEGHHEDYNKPLEVIWLCKKHHVEKHYNISP